MAGCEISVLSSLSLGPSVQSCARTHNCFAHIYGTAEALPGSVGYSESLMT